MANISNGMIVTTIKTEVRGYKKIILKSSSEMMTPTSDYMYDVIERLISLLGENSYIVDEDETILKELFDKKSSNLELNGERVLKKYEGNTTGINYEISIKKVL